MIVANSFTLVQDDSLNGCLWISNRQTDNGDGAVLDTTRGTPRPLTWRSGPESLCTTLSAYMNRLGRRWKYCQIRYDDLTITEPDRGDIYFVWRINNCSFVEIVVHTTQAAIERNCECIILNLSLGKLSHRLAKSRTLSKGGGVKRRPEKAYCYRHAIS